jgi:hypothetical protein
VHPALRHRDQELPAGLDVRVRRAQAGNLLLSPALNVALLAVIYPEVAPFVAERPMKELAE